MRTKYIKKVAKELTVSYKLKKEIIRDLNEIFDSAIEHGEAQSEIIQRLGSPSDFAKACAVRTADDLAFNRTTSRLKKSSAVSFVGALLCFALAFVSYKAKVPKGVIGQAEALTDITVISNFNVDAQTVLLIIGLIFAIIAVAMTVISVCKNNLAKF